MPNDYTNNCKIVVTCGKIEICEFVPVNQKSNDFYIWQSFSKDFDFEYIEFMQNQTQGDNKPWIYQLPDILIS